MFSYRHAFHAGNHADVLKHAVLVALMQYLGQKDTALMLVDTHAGAGLYRLDGDYANTSGEAAQGIGRLWALKADAPTLVREYLGAIEAFNPAGKHTVYPGSPFLLQHLMRAQDRLKVFETHPTDGKTLSANLAQLDAGTHIAVQREDGFEGSLRLLPPPSRRGLVLCDPSYEIKSDYARVPAFMEQLLQRFATGTLMVWYPIIGRAEAHALPRKLRTLATKAGKPWLDAQLTVKSAAIPKGTAVAPDKRPGLPASGVFVLNPPFTLQPALAEALPWLVKALGQDRHAAHKLEAASR